MPDLAGSEVGVPEDKVAWLLLAELGAGAVAVGQPAALSGGSAGQLDADLGVGDLGEAGAVPGDWPGRAYPVAVTVVAFRPGEEFGDAFVAK
jgi:hypothetical protein